MATGSSGPSKRPAKKRNDSRARPAGRSSLTRGSRGPSTAAQARTSSRAADQPPRPARTRFTSRMAILVVVASVLMVSYASSLRAYLVQREQIADLNEQIDAHKAGLAQQKSEKGRWSDPAYVEARARERFGWVMPGETSYSVIGPDGKALPDPDGLGDLSGSAPSAPSPWWEKVETSIALADDPPEQPASAESTETKQDKKQ